MQLLIIVIVKPNEPPRQLPPRPESSLLPERTIDSPNNLGDGKNNGAQPGRIEPPTRPTPPSVEQRTLISTSATDGPEAGQRPIQAAAQAATLPAMRIEEEENEDEDEDDDEDEDEDETNADAEMDATADAAAAAAAASSGVGESE